MPRCPDCDEKVSAQDAECPNCGTPLRAARKKAGGGSSTTATIIIILAAAGGTRWSRWVAVIPGKLDWCARRSGNGYNQGRAFGVPVATLISILRDGRGRKSSDQCGERRATWLAARPLALLN